MADAQIMHAKKVSSKDKQTKEKDKVAKITTVPEGTNMNLPTTSAQTSDTRKKVTPPTKPTPSNVSHEVLLVLQEMNENLKKTDSRLENLSKRVDGLSEFDGTQYEEDELLNEDQNDDSEFMEPPAKRQRVDDADGEDGENDPFRGLVQKYQQTEIFDSEVNENLANFINSSFRSGVADDTLSQMVKDIHRPANCEALAPTRVNKPLWGLLSDRTQSDDMKYQNIQKMIVKATSNVTKVCDKNSDYLDPESMEWTFNAVALLGQAFKLVNNRRKEQHRQDFPSKLSPLTSASHPYTDQLYGDDVSKHVKDIQDLSRFSQTIRGYNNRGRRRAGRFRGMMRGGRGRGYRGQSDYEQYNNGHPQTYSSRAKNQRGHKR